MSIRSPWVLTLTCGDKFALNILHILLKHGLYYGCTARCAAHKKSIKKSWLFNLFYYNCGHQEILLRSIGGWASGFSLGYTRTVSELHLCVVGRAHSSSCNQYDELSPRRETNRLCVWLPQPEAERKEQRPRLARSHARRPPGAGVRCSGR